MSDPVKVKARFQFERNYRPSQITHRLNYGLNNLMAHFNNIYSEIVYNVFCAI